jgi:Flp pilus assembly pilin Flp
MADAIRAALREEDGQDAVEYGLIIATIAIVVLLATAAFGTQIHNWFISLTGRITTT